MLIFIVPAGSRTEFDEDAAAAVTDDYPELVSGMLPKFDLQSWAVDSSCVAPPALHRPRFSQPATTWNSWKNCWSAGNWPSTSCVMPREWPGSARSGVYPRTVRKRRDVR
ncbi:hypothetical protein SBA4_700008 [Candidatus Sulfopaludibacter sp. SbA4]|nr:hypothetical protein SBA4_700008 [Candidatus Sulfopaludibacter sp. SbA4]